MRMLLDELRSGRILLCDGAMGTELHRRGLPQGRSPEKWNLSHPDEVRAVSASYVAAGSDIVETNTLGGSRLILSKHGLADRLIEINRRSAQLAREAAGDRYVFGAVGPIGEFLSPLGPLDAAEAIDIMAEQMVALAEGGVDALCIETQVSLDEAVAAVKAAKERTNLPAIVTMTFRKTPKREFRSIMGDAPEQMVRRLTEAGADVLGSNCGQGPAEMLELCRKLRPLTGLALMIQSNAGLPTMENGGMVYKVSTEEMAALAVELAGAGAQIIGGCCGTTPSHIRAMRDALDRVQF